MTLRLVLLNDVIDLDQFLLGSRRDDQWRRSSIGKRGFRQELLENSGQILRVRIESESVHFCNPLPFIKRLIVVGHELGDLFMLFRRCGDRDAVRHLVNTESSTWEQSSEHRTCSLCRRMPQSVDFQAQRFGGWQLALQGLNPFRQLLQRPSRTIGQKAIRFRIDLH